MTDGLPMGSSISPLLANIYMDYIENIIFNSKQNILKNIILWKRYVDDIFCIWSGNTDLLKVFLNFINNINNNIKFTLETEINHNINFLDLSLTKDIVNHNIIFDIYRKNTFTDTIIPNDSLHFHSHKISAFNNYIHRMLSLPLSKENLIKETKIIKQIALNNGYNCKIIDKLIERKENILKFKSLLPIKRENDQIKYISFTYSNFDIYKLKNIFKQFNLHVTFKTKNTIKTLFSNNKDLNSTLKNSGVYQLICNDCNSCYIGETGRSIEIRIKEHLRDRINSEFGKHLFNEGHSINNEKSKLLHRCNKGIKLKLYEALEIDRRKKKKNNDNIICLNKQNDLNFQPLYRLLF